MKKLSKLTALLLALVLALSVPLQVVAESTEIETKTEYYEVADLILQKRIRAYETYGEYWDMAKLIEEEDFNEFYYGLSEEDQQAMAEYIEAKFWAACVPFTGVVGPFLPAVDVSAQSEVATLSLLTRDATATIADEETENGLILNKTATGPNDDGTYTITLEAYVTGTVTTTTTTKTVPVDIVMVLDMSQSMSQSFGSTTRIAALKTAVNNFIAATAEKYDADTADHRISIVTYNSSATVSADWTYVDTNGSSSLQATVTGLKQATGTNTHLGIAEANTQLTTNYDYDGTNTTRQKVVILFTDGVPGTSSGNFDEEAAVTAITNAKTIKDSGATVYSVAIYDSADPATAVETTPDSDVDKINAMLHAISSNYPDATAEYTETSSGNNNGNGPGQNQSDGTFTVTYGDGGNNDYYLTASDPDDLNNIFQTISSNIQTGASSMQLTETTVVVDVMSDYFELPDNFVKDSITVQTALYNGSTANPQWTVESTLPFTPEIEFGDDETTGNDYVSVKNFDYAANFVSETGRDESDATKTGTFKGRKLIITFNVVPTNGFVGGNDVVTNDPSSGIYVPSTDDSSTLENVEFFPEPDVDVELWELVIEASNQHIYLGNTADLDALLTSFGIWYKEVDGDGIKYKVDGTLNAYATIKFTLTTTDSKGNNIDVVYTIDPGEESGAWTYYDTTNGTTVDEDAVELLPLLTSDKTYTVKFDVIPKEKVYEEGEDTSYTGVVATDGYLYPTVYVYTPEVTFQDSVEQYMATVDEATQTAYYEGNNKLYTYSTTTSTNADGNEVVTAVESTGVVWRNTTKGLSTENTMSGLEPKLTFTYTEVEEDEEEWLNSNKQVTATEDVEVTVTTTITGDTTLYGDQAQAKYIRNKVTTCPDECKATNTYVANTADDPAFVVHIIDVYGSLTITKEVTGDGASEDDTFLFTITGPGITGKMQVILKGGESVTINNLKIGDYIVTEDTSWSWRYTCSTPSLTKAVASKTSTEFQFTNNLETKTWLDGNAHADNDFNQTTTE